ncbi:MAG: type II CRISPR RNA-guided endonuclease Cas9 [Actinobacteria bacterium]|nr:type II CRISPR RNA-guided endonuclease Cas9 [Actinomycetota bacterium]
MKTRLALDLGTNSIGWSLFKLDSDDRPKAIIRGGVRIFGDGRDPMSGASLAVDRRLARQMRRNRDRRIKRLKRVMNALIEFQLMPESPDERRLLENLDPYELRRRGLDEPLEAHELGRALFHLAKRRGFLSNRKADPQENESSMLKARISEVRGELQAQGLRTVGEWLAARKAHGLGTRARLKTVGEKDRSYDLYIDRAMVLGEFETLWEAQAKFHPGLLSIEAKEAIHEALSFQRPLLPVRPGRCSLETEEYRAPIALPSSQRFRIYQEVNAIRIEGADHTMAPLAKEQRDLIVTELFLKQKVSFAGIRTLLKLGKGMAINLEGAKREELKGDITGYLLAGDEAFGPRWRDLSLADQDGVVELLLGEVDDKQVVAQLQERFSCEEHAARAISALRLPEGYYKLSRLAMSKVLPELEAEVVVYSTAVINAGYVSHSALSHMEQTGEVFDELPYYGEILQRHVAFGEPGAKTPELEFGRVANPTVHIALGQLRQVVNEICREYGKPSQIVVEVTRDLKRSIQERKDVDKMQAERQKDNERVRAMIAPLLGVPESSVKRHDLEKYRLWEELGDVTHRQCPYSGETIGVGDLFTNKVQVEHILPFKRTLDDSLANKTVAKLRANQEKANRSPFEAFGDSPGNYDYEEILQRVSTMPGNKQWRFRPDAMERFEGDKDFLARALNDTAYIARLANEYLASLVGPNNVWSVPGRVTSRVRNLWQLSRAIDPDNPSKSRDDHRHHALDAAVIGVMDRGSLKAFADANAKGDGLLDDRIEAMPLPWPTYVQQVQRMIAAIQVSHRPNHGYQRAMANETQYGLRTDGKVATRKSLEDFDTRKKLEDAEFADTRLKAKLLSEIPASVSTGKEFKLALAEAGAKLKVRRARVLATLAVTPISLPEGLAHRAPRSSRTLSGMEYKGLKGDANYCIEIVANAKGKWLGEVITTQQAYEVVRSMGAERLRHPLLSMSEKPLIMRLMRDDVCQVEIDGRKSLMRLCSVSKRGRMAFAEINEANVDARNRNGEDAFTYVNKTAGSLEKLQARLAKISPSGRVTLV